jgi:hypothetical protein
MRYVGVLAVTFALAGAAAGQTVRSGLYGTVMRGPITPVCVAEQPCSEPAAGAQLVFWRNGTAVARTTVATDGSYRLHLAAGLYTVRASQKRLEPVTARVIAGRMLRLDFSIDTGIR